MGDTAVFNLPEHDTWREQNGYTSCSFCGSMQPEEFLKRIAEGEEVIPTDKNYKAYVGAESKKFYFQHLSKEQRNTFIALHNAKTMKIGYPGHFYVAPFFCSRSC